jgi:hypothetical protein
MNYHKNHNQFEKSTTGNVLSEILREVEKAREVLLFGNTVAATIHLDYIETIMEDACEQYGANAVFGNLEISKLLATA